MAKNSLVLDINRKEDVLVVSHYLDDDSDTMNITQKKFSVDATVSDQVILLEGYGSVLENLGYKGNVTVVIPQSVAIRLFQILKLSKESGATVDSVVAAATMTWMGEDMIAAVRQAVEGTFAAKADGANLRIVSALSLYSHRLQGTDDAVIAGLHGKTLKIENSVVTTANGDPVEGITVRDNSYVTGEFACTVNEIVSQKGEVRHEATIPRYYRVVKDGTPVRMTGFEVSADMTVDGTSDSVTDNINMIRLHVTGAAALPRKVMKKKLKVTVAE